VWSSCASALSGVHAQRPADGGLERSEILVKRVECDEVVAVRARLQCLRLLQLHEGCDTDTVALALQRELLVCELAIARLELDSLAGSTQVEQCPLDVRAHAQLLRPLPVRRIVFRDTRLGDLALPVEALEDRQRDRELRTE